MPIPLPTLNAPEWLRHPDPVPGPVGRDAGDGPVPVL